MRFLLLSSTALVLAAFPLQAQNPAAPAGGGRAGGPAAITPTVGDYNVTVEVAGEKLVKSARVRDRIQ